MTTNHVWRSDEVRTVSLELFDERLQRYRLVQPRQERTLAQSLERYGQISPVVICLQEQNLVLVDGFKRLRAARKLKGMERLAARCIEVDEQGAKAAIYNLNRVGQRPVELEESWIIHAPVREDGLSQVEAAQLLGRHKSWVNRRLAMPQDVFVRAWRKLGTFRSDATFGTWLYRLALNVVVERRRSEASRRAGYQEDPEASGRLSSPPATPEARLDFEAALVKLPDGAREIFVLHDVEGYKHGEIAEFLDISVGTSKAQLHRRA